MVKCELCGEATYLKLKIKKWKIYKCRKCKIAFLYPYPENIEKIYNHDYFGKWYLPLYRKRKKYNKKIIKKLKKFIPEKGKVLDVGCGIGIFLDIMKEKGYQIYGQDISFFAVEYCRRKNLPVFNKDLLNLNFENEFDIITMMDVIAHTKNPLDYLQKCKKLLKPYGILIIKTPLHSDYLFFIANFFSFIEKSKSILHIPNQIYHFDKHSLSNLAKMAGFKISKIMIVKEFVDIKVSFLTLWKLFMERSLIVVLRNE